MYGLCMWRSEAEVKSSWITFHLIHWSRQDLPSELRAPGIHCLCLPWTKIRGESPCPHGILMGEFHFSHLQVLFIYWTIPPDHMYPLDCFAFVFCSGLTISTSPASLREKFHFCVCVFCLHTLQFACALHACLLATEARRRHWTSWGWNYRAVVQHGIWELSSLPLNHCTEPFPHTKRVKNFTKLEKAL